MEVPGKAQTLRTMPAVFWRSVGVMSCSILHWTWTCHVVENDFNFWSSSILSAGFIGVCYSGTFMEPNILGKELFWPTSILSPQRHHFDANQPWDYICFLLQLLQQWLVVKCEFYSSGEIWRYFQSSSLSIERESCYWLCVGPDLDVADWEDLVSSLKM